MKQQVSFSYPIDTFVGTLLSLDVWVHIAVRRHNFGIILRKKKFDVFLLYIHVGIK